MAEKPILFSTPMARAVRDYRKTMTRRIINGVRMFDPEYDRRWRPHVCPPGGSLPDEWSWWEGPAHGPSLYHKQRLPISRGDTLWVREPWRAAAGWDYTAPRDIEQESARIYYDADDLPLAGLGKLRPGMFMCRWMSRITLRVTAVKVERLQDMTLNDYEAEGIVPEGQTMSTDEAVSAFRTLWETLNGPGSWEANPWVAAYSFERVK